MAFCINCGQELAEGAKFCANCGKAVNDNSKSERKTVYDGEIHKCPNCGEIIDSFVGNCPACGHELRGAKANSSVMELSKKLENAWDSSHRIQIIRNFYIPNTKEDIYEFFILALSNIKIGGIDSSAWMVKLEQAYQKAELLFGLTQDYERLKVLYKKAQAMNRVNKTRIFSKKFADFLKSFAKCFRSGYAWAILCIVIGGLLCFIGGDPEESGLTVGGIFCIIGGAWIALFTLMKNDNKSNQ